MKKTEAERSDEIKQPSTATHGKARIGMSLCREYEWPGIKAAVDKTVSYLGGFEKFIPKGSRVLLKPNLLSAREPDRAVTTHPLMVRAVAERVMEAGGRPFIADSPSIASARRVAAKSGILEVARNLGIELKEFSGGIPVMTERRAPFAEYMIAPEAMETDIIINLPKIKTHQQMVLTLGVKNMFGCMPGKLKAQWHFRAGADQEAFAALLLDIYHLVGPTLTIMDGIVGMEGNGPNTGTPRRLGWLLAATDCVALDVLISALLGLQEELPTTTVAKKRGIGVSRLDNIEVVGASWREEVLSDFAFPPLTEIDFPLPAYLKRFLKKSITTYPGVQKDQCVLCMECTEVCPVGAAASNQGEVRIDLDRCIRCYCCQETCPEGAIYLKKGWLQKLLKM